MPHHFDGRGFKIHYVEEGTGDAVVFAHGAVMDHTMFAAQFEELPDAYRCVALDLRGHGRSECPPGPWSMRDCVDDVIAFIEGVGAAPCHLAGMSWGGMIALRVAIQRPDLVRSLVPIDTAADADPPERAELTRWFMSAIEEQGLTDEIIAAGAAQLFGERYREDHPEGIEAYADRLKTMRPEAIVEALRAVVERDSVLGALGEIKVPALVIHGEADVAIPVEEGEKIAAGIPGARLVRLPDVGHTSPLEAPDAVNEALADFLRSAR